MSEPFVLATADGARWVMHPPQDPHGDGYVHTIRTELHEDELTAATTATVARGFDGRESTLADFAADLAAGWQGWDGARTWHSMDRELSIEARHDQRGHVSLSVTLRRSGSSWDHSAWSATAVFELEAGEELTRLARDLAHWTSTPH